MRQLIYAMRFSGLAEPLGSVGSVLKAAASAPSSRFTTTVGRDGLTGTFEPVPGKAANCESEVIFTGETSFQEVGTIRFGEGNWLRFASVGSGFLAPSVDPTRQQGAVTCRVEGGAGQFAGASGLITSILLLDTQLGTVDHHFGILFLP